MKLVTRRGSLLVSAASAMLWGRQQPLVSSPRLPAWLSRHEQELLTTILSSSSLPAANDNQRDNNNNQNTLAMIQKEFLRKMTTTASSSSSSCGANILLMGDATHGTQEFYQLRSDLTQYLIQQGVCQAVLVEGDVGPFSHVDRYVAASIDDDDKRTSHQRPLDMNRLQGRFPAWMWGNAVMQDFVEWLRDYNHHHATTTPIHLLGMDIYSIFESMDIVLDYFEKYPNSNKKNDLSKARQSYETLQSFYPNPKMYTQALFNNVVQSQQGNVQQVLGMALARQAQLPQKVIGPQDDVADFQKVQQLNTFYAVQNARAVVASEAYFRLSSDYSSSTIDAHRAGNVATWNLRDRAFLDAIQTTVSFLKTTDAAPVNVIVWAHNSHVGNIQATDRAVQGYTNLYQQCQQKFGSDSVTSLGMTTHDGTVRASKAWGDPDEVMQLVPAFEGSHEYLLHAIAKHSGENVIAFALDDKQAQNDVDVASRALFGMDRVERFVGVSYSPEAELKSHYNICNLSRQFDFLIHVDHSSALRVHRESNGTRRHGIEMRKEPPTSKWDQMLLDEYGGSDYDALFKTEVAGAIAGERE